VSTRCTPAWSRTSPTRTSTTPPCCSPPPRPEAWEEKPKAKSLATWGPFKVLTALSGMSFGLIVLFQLADKIVPVVWTYLMSLSP
jgi:hypothetical protein